jgi:hypothetical protein
MSRWKKFLNKWKKEGGKQGQKIPGNKKVEING